MRTYDPRGDPTPRRAYKQCPGATAPGSKQFRDLANMSRDEFRHLEHADLALAVKYRPEIVVRVDHGSFLFVLTTVPLDIVPKLFGKLGTR